MNRKAHTIKLIKSLEKKIKSLEKKIKENSEKNAISNDEKEAILKLKKAISELKSLKKTKFYYAVQENNFQYRNFEGKNWIAQCMFSRCLDFQNHNKPSQDYLCIRYDKRYIISVVCDGVSQSFYGNIAAKKLGINLLEKLWQNRKEPPSKEEFNIFLDCNCEHIEKTIAEKEIPDQLPSVLQQVLNEKKLQIGSETVFSALVIDIKKMMVYVYILGNIVVRVEQVHGEKILQQPDSQRWSSKFGRRGNIYHGKFDSIRSLTMYSDGLNTPLHSIYSQDALKKICHSIHDSEADDDITSFHFQLK